MSATIPTSLSAQARISHSQKNVERDNVSAQRTRTVIILLAAVFMSLLDVMIVGVAFPAMARYFGESSVAQLSWVLNAYAIVFAALLVPAGRWADLLGRKRLFLTGLALFTTASALCAAASSVSMLIGSRILQAAGAALLSPSATGLLLNEFPVEKRSIAVALFAAVGATAAAAGAHMSRQIGLALGVAILVAIIGDADGPGSLTQFRYGYFAMGLAALASGATCLALKGGDLASRKGEPI